MTCEYGQVDQLGEALRAHQTAQAAVPRAEERARQIIAAARKRVEETRAELAAEIVAEYERGAKQIDLIKRTGYSRERVRQILRAAGVEPG